MHVVQADETVAQIAGRYDSTVEDVVASSNLDDLNLIYPGQVLTVPLRSVVAALSATPVLTGSNEPVTGTTNYVYAAPRLVDPGDGEALAGRITLAWAWEQRLEPGEFFAVLLWCETHPAPCVLRFSVDRTCTFVLDGRAPGVYHWTVRVVEGSQAPPLRILKRFLTPEEEQRAFTWTGAES